MIAKTSAYVRFEIDYDGYKGVCAVASCTDVEVKLATTGESTSIIALTGPDILIFHSSQISESCLESYDPFAEPALK